MMILTIIMIMYGYQTMTDEERRKRRKPVGKFACSAPLEYPVITSA
jgi:hypothetical protein